MKPWIGSDSNDGDGCSAAEFVRTLIASRRNVSPKRLEEPGPDACQLEGIFAAAAAAPDHGELVPWRFVVVPRQKRRLLGEAFARALWERDPAASDDEAALARAKADRGPLLVLAVARHVTGEPPIREVEQIVSLGCAIQNMLLTLHAMGFGAGLASGQAMDSRPVRELFGLAADERGVCFILAGTVVRRKSVRDRPSMESFVTSL